MNEEKRERERERTYREWRPPSDSAAPPSIRCRPDKCTKARLRRAPNTLPVHRSCCGCVDSAVSDILEEHFRRLAVTTFRDANAVTRRLAIRPETPVALRLRRFRDSGTKSFERLSVDPLTSNVKRERERDKKQKDSDDCEPSMMRSGRTYIRSFVV
jgi:hypothetical protein